MPRLWTDTIESHRHEVHDAILAAAAALAEERGVTAVTMSDVATAAGIGRATLYKYFPNVEEILVAWHHAQVTAHLAALEAAAAGAQEPAERLLAVLRTYAHIAQQHRGSQIAAVVHRDDHDHGPRTKLTDFVSTLIADAAEAGQVRQDVPPKELAVYAVSAVQAAHQLSSRVATERLIQTITAGLHIPNS